MQKIDIKALRNIFFIQIALIATLGLLFFIGYAENGIKLGSFFFVIVMGTLGATVSLMKRILENKPLFSTDNRNFRIFSTLIPILYGTVMAGLSYLFFMSGILSGDGGGGLFTSNLFPNFTTPDPENGNLLEQFILMSPHGMQNTGKLLVWAFLAGYSERFVTGILRKLEGHAGGSA